MLSWVNIADRCCDATTGVLLMKDSLVSAATERGAVVDNVSGRGLPGVKGKTENADDVAQRGVALRGAQVSGPKRINGI